MSLIYLNEHKFIKYGGKLDECTFCAEDYAEKNKVSYGEALLKVRGQLEGEKIVKFRRSGGDIVICEDHINKMQKLLKDGKK